MGKVHAVISLPAASFLALRAGKRYLEMILMGIRGPKALGGSDGTGPDPCVPRISAEISCPDRPPYSSVGDEVLLSDSFRGGDRPGATLSLDPAAFIGIFALGVTLSHLGESAWIQRVEPKIAV